jgi:hypothetical protein
VSAVVFGIENMPVSIELDSAVLDSEAQANTGEQDIDYPALGRGLYAGRVVLIVAGKSDDWTGVAPPSGFTEAVDTSTTTGSDQGLYVAYRIDTDRTAVDAGSLVVTGGATADSDVIVLALAGGFQTMTVSRNVDSLPGGKAHDAYSGITLVDPLIYAF